MTVESFSYFCYNGVVGLSQGGQMAKDKKKSGGDNNSGLGSFILTLGSAFLPLVTRKLSESSRRRQRRRVAQEYSKSKAKDVKRMTKTRMKMLVKYYPKVSAMVRKDRDEAMAKVGSMYRKRLHEE